MGKKKKQQQKKRKLVPVTKQQESEEQLTAPPPLSSSSLPLLHTTSTHSLKKRKVESEEEKKKKKKKKTEKEKQKEEATRSTKREEEEEEESTREGGGGEGATELVDAGLIRSEKKEHYTFIECKDYFKTSVFPTGHELLEEEEEGEEEVGTKFFEWLIAPVTLEEFYTHYWEKKALIIKRNRKDYYQGWFSKKDIDNFLRKRQLHYSKHLDITKYSNGKRTTHNPKGRAQADDVWNYFANGYSVRLLHPQQYSNNIWKMVSTLEEFWGCQGGCNAYLTPKNSQGFAPHYDDVEAFVIQTEGAKNWKLYSPRDPSEILPRYSSPNFKQGEIGEPFVEALLEEGDLLYFPRGFIHQAVSLKESHSLHLTVSTGLNNSWADFLSLALPRAVELAREEIVELRQNLPLNFFEYMGVVYSDQDEDQRREDFTELFATLATKVLEFAPLDSAADHMATEFIRKRLPPYSPTPTGNGSTSNGKQSDGDHVRLTRRSAARLVIEDDLACIYSPLNNKREAHAESVSDNQGEEEDVLIMEFSMEYAPALELLIQSYPRYLEVNALPIEKDDEKLKLVEELLKCGVLTKRHNEGK